MTGGGVVSANPREYLCAQVKYEAPASPRDNLVLETGTIVDESQLRRLKTTVQANASTASSNSETKINSSATRRENQEEDSSESMNM